MPHKIVKFTQGVAFENDPITGKKVNVKQIYAYEPEDCESDLSCADPVIRFVDSEGTRKEIPLEQLYNFLDQNSILDTTTPSKMTISSVTPTGQTTMDLVWDETGVDANLASVEVFRDNVLVATVVAGTEAYSDTGLTAATAYSYTIRGVDLAGNKGELSDPVVGTTDA